MEANHETGLMDRPRIDITMRLELESDRFYLSRHYSEAVEAAGGAPVHISLIPRRDYISTVMDELHGVLLPGRIPMWILCDMKLNRIRNSVTLCP